MDTHYEVKHIGLKEPDRKAICLNCRTRIASSIDEYYVHRKRNELGERTKKVRGSITMHDLTQGMNASLASFSKLGIEACPETDADTSFTF